MNSKQPKIVPGDSDSGQFGGNSSWRGPIWMPINYLILEALEHYHHFSGDQLQVECPVGSGRMRHLKEVAEELAMRMSSLFRADKNGRCPWQGDEQRFANDPL